ncbi:MAG: response regulator [Burkholderiaceae bacterium]|mgnify:CR=1 FL=1|nr:response regulator [Burkholderiaceae bacterium]MDZ4145576.1 response regulator [Burkholderiales bacterium]
MHEQTILVVEDNPDHLELTLLTLQEQSIRNEIAVAHDGVEALNYLFGEGLHAGRDTTRQPDLVLLDLKLPKLTGLEVLQRMRADPRTAVVPVVVLTSSSEEEDIVAVYRSGANSFVRKPVDFVDFTEKLRQVKTYWLSVNESRPLN